MASAAFRRPPVIWSIAGHDTSGGAGLSADQRAADALGVHLCPVVACITAQHSQGVDAVFAVPVDQLQAQLSALANDLPPAAIKTGLLASVAAIQTVCQWVDRLRQVQPGLILVVDPVLGASAGGAAFSDAAVLQAYRDELLPRANLVTPNQAEARRLLDLDARHDGPQQDVPAMATRLRQQCHTTVAQGVVITGGDGPQARWAQDWLDTPQASGWLCAPRVKTTHHHGTGCTFATAAAAAMALGHGHADAVVLAKMLTQQALQQGHAAGQGPGPVQASSACELGPVPYLGLGHELPWQLTHGGTAGAPLFRTFDAPADGLYGILPDSDSLASAAEAGVRCLQLRHKSPQGIARQIEDSARHAARHGATLFINDHWQQALSLPDVPGLKLGLHLGQEDLLALQADDQARLLAGRGRVVLGLSSHSLWELARAAGCGASLIACGPVQATTTKDMPWRPQGEGNLRWWVAHSPAPVVAIGGLLTPDDLHRFAGCGPAALCVVRGLGRTLDDMQHSLPALRQAVMQARSDWAAMPHMPRTSPHLPKPVL